MGKLLREGREMENISPQGPTFGDFVTILLKEGSMQNNTVGCKTSEYKSTVQTPLSPLY